MAAPEVNVWVDGCWYGPSYPDAGDRSTKSTALDAVGDAPAKEWEHTPPPPKAGPGSSRAKWAVYAEQQGVEIPDGADRDAIIAACVAAKVPTD